MRTTEKVLIILAIMGETMHMFHLPAAGIITVLSLAMLSMFYFGLSWLLFRERETKANNIPLSIVAGVACSIAMIGILFKVMYWPGSKTMLFIGFAFIAILIIPYFMFMNKSRDKEDGIYKYYLNTLIRLMITASITSVLLLTPSTAILRIQYRDNPEYVRLMEQCWSDPSNEQYQKEMNNYFEKIRGSAQQ